VSSSIPFRPRSTSELVDAAFQLLRRDYMQYVMLMAISYVPWLVLLMATGQLTASASEIQSPGLFIFGMLAAMVWFTLIDAVMILAVSESYMGRPVDVGGAFRTAIGRVGSVLYAAIVKSLIVGVGLLLLIVPGVIWFAKYFAVPATIVIEGRSGPEGMKRSAQLSDGLKGHVLKTLALVWLIYFVLSIAAGMIGGGMALASRSDTMLVVFTQIVNAAFRIFLYPLIAIVQTLLYYDARIRKEGYDLELMAQDLSAPARPSASPAM
jgi:hypothetical protein